MCINSNQGCNSIFCEPTSSISTDAHSYNSCKNNKNDDFKQLNETSQVSISDDKQKNNNNDTKKLCQRKVPSTCEICNKTFKNKYIKYCHQKQIHGLNPVKCKFCDLTFINIKQMREHIEVDHYNYQKTASLDNLFSNIERLSKINNEQQKDKKQDKSNQKQQEQTTKMTSLFQEIQEQLTNNQNQDNSITKNNDQQSQQINQFSVNQNTDFVDQLNQKNNNQENQPNSQKQLSTIITKNDGLKNKNNLQSRENIEKLQDNENVENIRQKHIQQRKDSQENLNLQKKIKIIQSPPTTNLAQLTYDQQKLTPIISQQKNNIINQKLIQENQENYNINQNQNQQQFQNTSIQQQFNTDCKQLFKQDQDFSNNFLQLKQFIMQQQQMQYEIQSQIIQQKIQECYQRMQSKQNPQNIAQEQVNFQQYGQNQLELFKNMNILNNGYQLQYLSLQ
ncbi:hypothetical protein PPERSA_02296 [Pseudocohnilembus persalinus]|uniref:C2H2-type domain-containing protein n=1 Tax=Pseudocohnilembus persalinus TaxID=266149 RepID=A0A0V0QI19_PSEPJ|nr:hypothetical protein PPERSA_02296 [Pseudocohnilembus persalinus]|eukprot:KRX01768.1 hypothetical protein PPERSA_02296 [Pseudocohnilembus persalinus]